MNRQQRRAAAAADRKLKKVDNAEEGSPQTQADRITDLIKGKVKPPNDVVKYLVEKLNANKDELDELVSSLNQARQAAASMEKRIIALQGAHNKYLEDIRNWDKRVVEDEAEPESEPEEASEAK